MVRAVEDASGSSAHANGTGTALERMTNGMRSVRNKSAPLLYLVLGGLFLTALIACNLIANKFVSVDLGFKTFILSAGVLPYPITFLITDLLSELYGRKKTNRW